MNQSLLKIVIAQVFLLLSTIKEDKDRSKWESQAEQIRKVRSLRLGTPVFRQLLTSLAAS
jgi:CCR4-NOT transcription complex subunit 1